MTDHDELIRRLRVDSKTYIREWNYTIALLNEAADALEAQFEEIEKMKWQRGEFQAERKKLESYRDELRAALEAASLNERRYMYLRKYAESVTGLRLNWYCDEMDNWGDNSPSFDAAIDAALSGEGAGG